MLSLRTASGWKTKAFGPQQPDNLRAWERKPDQAELEKAGVPEDNAAWEKLFIEIVRHVHALLP